MKDFIQKLQQYPKAWGKFELLLEESNLEIDCGYLQYPFSYTCEGFNENVDIPISEESSKDFFLFIGEFLNSFIESEGYYVDVTQILDNVKTITGYIIDLKTAKVTRATPADYELHQIAEAKQSAIIEAFKLIEQGL